MTWQLGALRDALEDAGASPDKARAAAAEVAGYRSPLASVEIWLTILIVLVSGLYALGGTVLWQVFRLSAQVSSVSVQISAIGAHLSALVARGGA
jgi:predicted small integral membrane protein